MADDRIEELKRLLPQCFLPDWVRLGSRLVRLLQDAHHPRSHDAVLNRLLAQARDSADLCARRKECVPTVDYPSELPITARKDEIVAAIRKHQVVVIAGETGSGKTTQIPKMCLEAGLGIHARIGCTQPRRVAAMSISRRIAEELNVDWGREVGCKIRFDDRSNRETYIKMMTDGILLAETQGDPLLSEYNALIIDEAHERSLNIDFLLGYLKGLLQRRDDLKLIITSATIDTASFSKAFHDAPIIEVSGRLYPVDVIYQPFDHESEERGDITYIDAAVDAVDRIVMEPGGGDVLIFMPGERDIRETRDLLEGRYGDRMDIIPLFGRLSSGEQQRVFAPGSRARIVIATNIAETSLTIPGIRYVVDTGLARISRYNSRTRTRRLPVEPISQSSANQRKGRCGRVRNGICVRLYTEDEFEEKPAYTQPEIQRSNLAEVILRMKAFRLGEIETFPFLNPPTPAAINSGYNLLQELGALDEKRELTPLGFDLARLPIDPTLGRMLIQSQSEHATRELLIIAAGLSIQDPRERPLDKQEAADAAHRRFLDTRSDFLTLLNIWNALHDQWETLRTQNQRRKFCKANFLSYTRMREWQDLHAQLRDALEDRGQTRLRLNESNAAYEAIHRSILTGLLGHVARRVERNAFQTSGNRRLMVFPGSVLFDRQEKKRRKGASAEKSEEKPASTHQPPWIMAGEIVETSQLYARTVAGIDPCWIVQLAPHICRFSYQNSHWSSSAGRVLVHEKASLYGLEIQDRKVDYGRIDAKEATEIFIRSALVEEDLLPKAKDDLEVPQERLVVPQPRDLRTAYPFLEHNARVRRKIENWRTRTRRHDLHDLDQLMFDFYASRLENISSVHELNRFLRELKNQDELCIDESRLSGGQALDFDEEAFPNAVTLAGQPVALSYDYAPGEERDGVTLKLPWSLAETISPAALEWAVPGLREKQIGELLRALPKSIRKQLMPFPPKIQEIVTEFIPTGESFHIDLAKFIHRRYGVDVAPESWSDTTLPSHLRPRIEIVDAKNQPLAAGRDLHQLQIKLEQTQQAAPIDDSSLWHQLTVQWERFDLADWNFGDVPERLTVSESGAVPVYAWPGLQLEDGKVSLRLFRARDAARRATLPGLQRLVEMAVRKDLAWLVKDLRDLRKLDGLYAPWGSVEDLESSALDHLKQHVLPREVIPELKKAYYDQAVDEARERLRGLAVAFVDLIREILTLCSDLEWDGAKVQIQKPAKARVINDLSQLKIELASAPTPRRAGTSNPAPKTPGLKELLPENFLHEIPFEQLCHVPRYLKAMRVREERARLNPAKDQDRARQLEPYVKALRRLREMGKNSLEQRRRAETFRWMIEEFKVSLFAQELGTATPVSPKRLDEFLAG